MIQFESVSKNVDVTEYEYSELESFSADMTVQR